MEFGALSSSPDGKGYLGRLRCQSSRGFAPSCKTGKIVRAAKMDVRRFPEHLTLVWEAPENAEEDVNNFVFGTGWNRLNKSDVEALEH